MSRLESSETSSFENRRFKPFSIGLVEVNPNLILAPMSGVTNICFRQLIKELNPDAVGLLVTEFISVEGIVRDNRQSMNMMNFDENERPLSVQIFGSDVNHIVDAAIIAEDRGADILDINCGCPVPKVVRRGGGCELMRQPKQLESILSKVKKELSIPLTLKIRAGWDCESRNALEIAKIAEGCGVSMLAIHGRTRTERYRGEADWSIIEEVATSLKIPVVGSGDVVCLQSAQKALDSKVAGIMIGRGALNNPWIFGQLNAELNGSSPEEFESYMVPEMLLRYEELLIKYFPEKAILGKLKQLSSCVTKLIHRTQSIRRDLCKSQSRDEFRDILFRWRDELRESPGGVSGRYPVYEQHSSL